MAHTFTCLYYHIVFGTRFRRPLITSEMRPRLWAYMGGIARENRLRALTINGMADHAHMLISLNPAIALADAIKEIKAGSSSWMSSTIGKDFKWQEGYAGFTVSLSNLESVKHYIDHQEEHHRKMDFPTEWKLLLEKHSINPKAR